MWQFCLAKEGEQKGEGQTKSEQRVQLVGGDPVKLCRFIPKFVSETEQKKERERQAMGEGKEDLRG